MKYLITKISILIIVLASLFLNNSSEIYAACAGYNEVFNSCLAGKGSDPTANSLCTIEAGSQCGSVDRRDREPVPPPVRNTAAVPDFSDPLSNDFVPWNPPVVTQPSAPVDEPADAPLQIVGSPVIPIVPSQPSTVVRPRPAPAPRTYTPVATCRFGDLAYFPSQKRYECSEPKKRGVCEADAGYGVPFICDQAGNWQAGNGGVAECSNECVPENAKNYVENTCIYSERRDDGLGDVCYAGTGGYGFNPSSENGAQGCVYSYGPVECPVLPEEQPTESAPASEGMTCEYAEWSDETPYDCSNGYACYSDWYLSPNTSCQPTVKEPNYHCIPDPQCDSRNETVAPAAPALSCEPRNFVDENPYSCGNGYACYNRWKIAGGDSCEQEPDYGNDGNWYECYKNEACNPPEE